MSKSNKKSHLVDLSPIEKLPGIGRKIAWKVMEELGRGHVPTAMAAIKANPYCLIDVDGIAWKKADRVAREHYGIELEDPRRHCAGNRYILSFVGVCDLRTLVAEREKIDLFDHQYLENGIEKEKELYWLPEELEAELGLERWIRHTGKELELKKLNKAQKAVCENMGLDDQQIYAVRVALANQVVCLTGGAGTGKTHVIAAIARCELIENGSVKGMAYAGKAADRMREAFEAYGIGAEASTIHKGLAWNGKHWGDIKLYERQVVLDECSMIPNYLLWAVVDRLSAQTRLIMVGDPNQLPPIGHGEPFRSAIEAGIPRVHLGKNYRQRDQQGILKVAEGILERKRPEPAPCVGFQLGIPKDAVNQRFEDMVTKYQKADLDSWQCITWKNEDVERFNLLAQAICNPDGAAYHEYPLWRLGVTKRNSPKHHAEIRKNDKVIVIKNSTKFGIFNGQTGKVLDMVFKPEIKSTPLGGEYEAEPCNHVRIQLAGQSNAIDIPIHEMDRHIQLGYVITVHKSQGSDWDDVIIIQPEKVANHMARKFFYTSVTRSKTQLTIMSCLRVVQWWNNAAADTPPEPTSLMRRLEEEDKGRGKATAAEEYENITAEDLLR